MLCCTCSAQASHMFQWAVSLEITGACPAPGRFYSELFTLHKRASDFQRYQVSLSTHFPNGKTDSKSRLHFSAANALVQRFPILSMVGWNLFFLHPWPRRSLMSKKFHLNTLIRMICKTSPINHLSFFLGGVFFGWKLFF